MTEHHAVENGTNTELSDWDKFTISSNLWLQERNNRPGTFVDNDSEITWNQLKSLTFPDISGAPILKLPLRIHLVQGPELGCSLTSDECVNAIVPSTNTYWANAGIQWELLEVVNKHWSSDETDGRIVLEQARETLWSLRREADTGAMADKPLRKKLFLNTLIPEHAQQMSTFDVFVFDFIGQQSQGCCISRETRTVVVGNRSTKGYPTPTTRPLPCLAKTLAHELGHALGLGHPHGQCFKDGTSCTLVHGGKGNLMTGGTDSKGGGGEQLENWQIVLARRNAECFLSEYR